VIGGSKHVARRKAILNVLPGLEQLEKQMASICAAVAQEEFGEESIELYNFHFLKQNRDLDKGSGFNVHVDSADDAKGKDRHQLLLSGAVKLTTDDQASEGTWMQVLGPSTTSSLITSSLLSVTSSLLSVTHHSYPSLITPIHHLIIHPSYPSSQHSSPHHSYPSPHHSYIHMGRYAL
jgi:hypothetical protein